MAKPRKNVEEPEPFYHIVIRDASRSTIRFGPIGHHHLAEKYGPKFTFEQVADDMRRHETFEALLQEWELDFGYTVLLVGDDGTNVPLWEVEYGQ